MTSVECSIGDIWEHSERLGEDIVYCSDFSTGKNVSYQLGATEGKKNDTGKVDWSLLHPDLVEPLIAALEYGEKKYGYENWQKDFGPNYRRRFCAARRRHEKDAWNDPLAINENDGGCYYLAQVAINALFELYHARKKAGLL